MESPLPDYLDSYHGDVLTWWRSNWVTDRAAGEEVDQIRSFADGFPIRHYHERTTDKLEWTGDHLLTTGGERYVFENSEPHDDAHKPGSEFTVMLDCELPPGNSERVFVYATSGNNGSEGVGCTIRGDRLYFVLYSDGSNHPLWYGYVPTGERIKVAWTWQCRDSEFTATTFDHEGTKVAATRGRDLTNTVDPGFAHASFLTTNGGGYGNPPAGLKVWEYAVVQDTVSDADIARWRMT